MKLRDFVEANSLTLEAKPRSSKKFYKGTSEKILYIRFSPELDNKQNCLVCSKGAAQAARSKTVKFRDLEVTYSEQVQKYGIIRADSNAFEDVDMG